MCAHKTHAGHLNPSLVRKLLASQFPEWADLPIAPVEPAGWDNKTYRLGDWMSVRLPSHAAYAPQVEKEQRWLPKLAPLLPLPIPVPLAMGVPSADFPFPWSVYGWIEGEVATVARIDDPPAFAAALADFLAALQTIDPTDGPPAGPHSFFRGGPLATYDSQATEAIEVLRGRIDTEAATDVWQAALSAAWRGTPVWVHGDVAASNLLVREGRLSAVIDFGCSAVGDPACDLAIAWTTFSGESRDAFRASLPLDGAAWARGRGWALWKALIVMAQHIDRDRVEAEAQRRIIDEVLEDAARAG